MMSIASIDIHVSWGSEDVFSQWNKPISMRMWDSVFWGEICSLQ